MKSEPFRQPSPSFRIVSVALPLHQARRMFSFQKLLSKISITQAMLATLTLGFALAHWAPELFPVAVVLLALDSVVAVLRGKGSAVAAEPAAGAALALAASSALAPTPTGTANTHELHAAIIPVPLTSARPKLVTTYAYDGGQGVS
jgi:hypothetical protein